MRAASWRWSTLLVAGMLAVLDCPLPLLSPLPFTVTQPASTSDSRPTPSSGLRRMRHPLLHTLAYPGAAPGAVVHLPGQLAAGRVDVVAAGTAQHGEDAGVEQLGLERVDGRGVRALEARAGEGIERYQVDLAGRQAAHEADQLLRMLRLIVHALHQGVFEGDRGARLARDPALAGRGELGQRIALVERHQLGAQLVVRRVQRYR